MFSDQTAVTAKIYKIISVNTIGKGVINFFYLIDDAF